MKLNTALERKKREKKIAKERKAMKNVQKVNKRKREAKAYHVEHQAPPMADDEVLSFGSPCDCPAHVHDRESPQKIEEVRFYTSYIIYTKSKSEVSWAAADLC